MIMYDHYIYEFTYLFFFFFVYMIIAYVENHGGLPDSATTGFFQL